MRKPISLLFLATLAASLTGVVNAGIVAIEPFVGSESETWESFANYQDGGFHNLNDPTTIMGGGASVSNPKMVVYQPDTGAAFGIGNNGRADVSDGEKGMGINGLSQTTTITFTDPVSSFGAFWGLANVGGNEGNETITFFDPADNVIDVPQIFNYSRPLGDGLLEWHGYSSSVPIGRLTYFGDGTAIDGLQASVPEPSSLVLAALGLLALIAWGRRNRVGSQWLGVSVRLSFNRRKKLAPSGA